MNDEEDNKIIVEDPVDSSDEVAEQIKELNEVTKEISEVIANQEKIDKKESSEQAKKEENEQKKQEELQKEAKKNLEADNEFKEKQQKSLDSINKNLKAMNEELLTGNAVDTYEVVLSDSQLEKLIKRETEYKEYASSYMSVIIGLVLGYVLVKGMFDNWKTS